MDPIEIALKEYEAIRQEILTSMNNRVSILSFGVAAIGAIFTASIAVFTSDRVLSGLMLTVAVPAIDSFILFMWLGEYQRMQRAGKFLVVLEGKINEMASATLLTWETTLRARRSHMNYPYNITALLLVVISIISIYLGLVTLPLSLLLKWTIGIAGLVLNLLLYVYAARSIAKLRL
ncbi:MAG TPA: hypothetical protein VGX48_20150 [Pyrinomonadaceae bacterium]|jgi:hypothetical protein|nr:hypothetical protein [Pyrinomonadaceae bacterium]